MRLYKILPSNAVATGEGESFNQTGEMQTQVINVYFRKALLWNSME